MNIRNAIKCNNFAVKVDSHWKKIDSGERIQVIEVGFLDHFVGWNNFLYVMSMSAEFTADFPRPKTYSLSKFLQQHKRYYPDLIKSS